MPSSNEYLRHAEESRRLAAQSSDERERETLLRIAAQWEVLAQYKVKKEAARDPKS